MFLQELLRNYILYREVIKPILGSWKESLLDGSNKENLVFSPYDFTVALRNANVASDGEELGWDISDEYEAKSARHISGTHTITNCQMFPVSESDHLCKLNIDSRSASASKAIYIVLMGDLVDEHIVNTRETYSQQSVAMGNFINLGMSYSMTATTGYENQQINSFLFETHEKREYLGEFSLTHEEIPLQYQLRGGEYHDIN